MSYKSYAIMYYILGFIFAIGFLTTGNVGMLFVALMDFILAVGNDIKHAIYEKERLDVIVSFKEDEE